MRDVANLSKIDMNLLVSLRVLVEEGSVSSAAKRLFITQSAMSRTLARMRQVFDDPLFVRLPHGLKPTPRALQLSEQLGPLLETVARCLDNADFEPARFSGQFVIASSATIDAHWLPRFLGTVLAEAPNLRVRTEALTTDVQQRLISGQIDFALQLAGTRPAELATRRLFTIRPICMFREGHPLSEEVLNPESVSRFGHVRHFVPGTDRAEAMLPFRYLSERSGRDSRIVYEGQSLEVILRLLQSSDLLFFGPHTVLGEHNEQPGLIVRECGALFDELAVEVELVFDRANEADPAYRWLEQHIVAAC